MTAPDYADLRRLLAEGKCLCSSASTDWHALAERNMAMDMHEVQWERANRLEVERDEARATLDAARAEALRDAANRWTNTTWSNVLLPFPRPPLLVPLAVAQLMGDWLRAEADRIEAGQ